MKYDHMNPQHQYLLEKIEEQERKLEDYDILCIKHDLLVEVVYGKDGLVEQIKSFNKMPWYKKMFYKFKL